ncbi:class I SAM-dependent methyltransferase [Thermosynechococcus sp. PP45]|uniref:class I SAM-dependent methyltransferase n=1 Tax=unclassified Thermosynechococcus TaxID=2622553 RepID=UPI0026738461|nr:class I SAM-dependent methyltransferase [Thermosynechococcus sp. PP45]WNC23706.1 class I SAM-dependent methyltransferase [Thermosynechococcus sp. PP551]WNC26282.1 class I SAM-dependent methyltransferase [Thermosynechococcus sp. PP555]
MKDLRELYRAEQLPVLQNVTFPTSDAARNCPKGDVVLVQDLHIGLVYNCAFQPKLLQYDVNYQNEQAVSGTFRLHLEVVTKIIQRHFTGCKLVEIGCGKGYFLEHLRKAGFSVTGVDPSYQGSSPYVIKACFTPALGIRADGLILRHVLEHIPEPLVFLEELRESNKGGTVYIEVPCFEWIMQKRAWFDIYYEHVNYFRLDDFMRIFGRVYEAGHFFSGQYLYVVADLGSLRDPSRFPIQPLNFPSDFSRAIDILASQLKKRRNQKIVWGGASKGVIFCVFMERAGVKIDAVVDINPAKQGKYLPSSGIYVLSPTELLTKSLRGVDIYVMNGNYLDEVRNMTSHQFNYFTADHE